MHPYFIYELKVPAGYDRALPTAINSKGVIVGFATGGSGGRAVRWPSAQTANVLPLPKGAQGSHANDINNAGDIVGGVSIAYYPRAASWIGGGVKVINQGAQLISVASTISNAGIIGGESDHVPCKWVNGAKVGMNGLPVGAGPGPSGFVTAIDSSGQAYGEFEDPINVAAKWAANGNFTNLTAPTPQRSGVSAANDAGMAVGYVFEGQLTKAHYWTPTGDGAFASPSPGSSYAFDVNQIGQAVGSINLPVASNACMWTGPVVTDLNDLIDPTLGWTLERATCMNDAGTIAGYGLRNGTYRGFVMAPLRQGRRYPPAIFWHIIHGVVDDSPGIVIGPRGNPVPVPPWGPLLRTIPTQYRRLIEGLLPAPRRKRK